jgi:hypothetical protein
MQVLYDPVRSEQLHHVYQDGRVAMQFVGKAAGTEIDFLFDNGASTNYVSSAFARMHVTVKPSDVNVRLGTGTSVSTSGECSVHIKLGYYQDKVDCYVLQRDVPVLHTGLISCSTGTSIPPKVENPGSTSVVGSRD